MRRFAMSVIAVVVLLAAAMVAVSATRAGAQPGDGPVLFGCIHQGGSGAEARELYNVSRNTPRTCAGTDPLVSWQGLPAVAPSPSPSPTTPAPTPTSPSPSPTSTSGVTCTATLGQNCGPYSDPDIPMSNGFDTYVSNQAVGPNSGTTQTIRVRTGPADWTLTANDVPYGYTGVQTFDAVQQLTNDWCGDPSFATSCANPTDMPLSGVPSLLVHYAESSPQDANSIYEFAPDVWNDSRPTDTMFWADTSPTRCTDNGLNTSDILGQATISGQAWTVYHFGQEVIFILDGTSSQDPVATGTCARQTSGTIDIKAGFQWLVDHGQQASLGSLSQLNTGWEVTSADNTTFTMNAYSITDN